MRVHALRLYHKLHAARATGNASTKQPQLLSPFNAMRAAGVAYDELPLNVLAARDGAKPSAKPRASNRKSEQRKLQQARDAASTMTSTRSLAHVMSLKDALEPFWIAAREVQKSDVPYYQAWWANVRTREHFKNTLAGSGRVSLGDFSRRLRVMSILLDFVGVPSQQQSLGQALIVNASRNPLPSMQLERKQQSRSSGRASLQRGWGQLEQRTSRAH